MHRNEEPTLTLWISLRRKCDDVEVDRGVALAQVRLACSPSGQGRFKFLDSVASIQSNPFTDSHAVATLTDVPVDNLDRVGTSDEDTGGQSWTSFTAMSTLLAPADTVPNLSIDSSRRCVLATFSYKDFTADRVLSIRCLELTPRGRDDATPRRCIST